MSALWLILAFVVATAGGIIMVLKTTNSDYLAWVAIPGVASWIFGSAASIVCMVNHSTGIAYLALALFLAGTILMAIPPIRSWRNPSQKFPYKKPQIHVGKLGNIIPFPRSRKSSE